MSKSITPQPQIIEVTDKIYSIRGHQVMLDFDLELLYNVETRTLKQAVKRNKDRFPNDFMFELTEVEIEYLVSQNVIATKGRLGGQFHLHLQNRELPVLSSVLKSKKALHVHTYLL